MLRGSHRRQRRHPCVRGLVPNGSCVGRPSLVAFVHPARGSSLDDTLDPAKHLLGLHEAGAEGCRRHPERAAANEPLDPTYGLPRVRESSVYTRSEPLEGPVRPNTLRSTEHLFGAAEPFGDACAELVDGLANLRNGRLEGSEGVFGLSQPFVEAQVRIQEDAIGDEILGALKRLFSSCQALIYIKAEIVKLRQLRRAPFRRSRFPCVRYFLRP
jgi:hypothetical protein